MGSGFSRDSVYNGLWTKGAILDIETGKNNRSIWDQVAGVGIEANTQAHVDIGVGRGIGNRIGNGLGNVMSMAGRSRSVVAPEIGSNLPVSNNATNWKSVEQFGHTFSEHGIQSALWIGHMAQELHKGNGLTMGKRQGCLEP